MRVFSTGRYFLTAVLLAESVFFASHASAWVEVDPNERIAEVVFDEARAGWVIQGQIDLDMDGDLDLLVGHEYESESFVGDDYIRADAYFNEDGRYFFSKKESEFPLPINGAELRRVRGAKDRAIVSYLSLEDGRDVVFTAWYNRIPEGGVDKEMHYFPESTLVEASSGDVIQEFYGSAWRERGVHISNVLHGYRKISLEDAREEFAKFRPEAEPLPDWLSGGGGAQESGEVLGGDAKLGEEKASVLDRVGSDGKAGGAEGGDSAKAGADKEKASILAVLIVLGSLGVAVVIMLYRRRRAD